MGDRAETEYERVTREMKELKYKRPDPMPPASMQQGSDKAALFWIAYGIVFVALAVYFGFKAGG